MKRILLLLLPVMLLASCDDTTDSIGMSLTNNNDLIASSTSEFMLESRSVKAINTTSRVSTGYLGKVKDPETGAYITCNYMTQVRPLDNIAFPADSTLHPAGTAFDFNSVEADSCVLFLYFPQYTGDTISLMTVTCSEMQTPMKENVAYKTDFDPRTAGLLRPANDGGIHKTVAYTLADQLKTAADRTGTLPSFAIHMNDEYTALNGQKYNNYGTYLMQQYYNPATNNKFANSYNFINKVCPGFYIENQAGLGAMQEISVVQLLVYFKEYITRNTTGIRDSLVHSAAIFPGTEEVMQHTYVSQDQKKNEQLIAEDTPYTYLKSPSGIFTEITLPIEDILKGHETDTLSSARLYVSSVNDEKDSQYYWGTPTTIAMIPTDSLTTFFEEKRVTDSRISYITTYSSSANGYVFGNISQLVSVLYDKKSLMMKSEGLSEEQWNAVHPSWNKVTLVPVQTTYSTLTAGSSVLTKVANSMKIQSIKLAKGDGKSRNVSMSVVYSKFKSE